MTASNTEITVVTLDNRVVQTTDARNLHSKLELKKNFSDWIKAQIARADLEEGIDYIKVGQDADCSSKSEQGMAQNTDTPKRLGTFGGDQRSTEYHLTLDACEHIALMSNTQKGKETRRQYIAIKKQFIADHAIAFEAQALKRIEANYEENLKHHPNYELGEYLKRAIRMEDDEYVAEMEAMLDKMDFEPAARATGTPVSVLRRKALSHMAASTLLGRMQRGEHMPDSPVLDVVEFARATVQLDIVKEKADRRLELQIARTPPTLDQIEAYDLAHKHDKPAYKH